MYLTLFPEYILKCLPLGPGHARLLGNLLYKFLSKRLRRAPLGRLKKLFDLRLFRFCYHRTP